MRDADLMDVGVRIATLGYHEVTDTPATTGFQGSGALPYKLRCRTFRDHLDRIADGPLTPVLVNEIDWTRPGRYLLLTFDDGGKSALWAGDELCRRGWRGHFFIVTNRIGTPTFLDPGEIRWLRRCGHAIGTHSHTHPDIFREESPERMAKEWRVSRDLLADLLGEPCVMGAVPGGDISRAVLRSAAAAQLRYLFVSEPWLRPREVDGCRVLGRVAPKVRTPASRVQRLARLESWGPARARRQLSVAARRVLAPLYRWHVSRTTRENGVRQAPVHDGS